MKLVLRHSIVSQLEVSLIESRRFQGQKRAVKDKYEDLGNVKQKASKKDQDQGILCVQVPDSMFLTHAGGLLSRDSPFLDIILEGVKLRLPSAGVAYPRVEPAIGAALLVHDALYGADEAPSSIGEAACSSASRDGSPPRCQDRHGVHPGSHGEVIFEPEGGLHEPSFLYVKMIHE